MEEELAPYRALLDDLRPTRSGPWEVLEGRAGACRVVAIVSDCGPANAAAACERLVACYAPAAVLHGGAAGALDPDLLPGDVVVGSRTCLLHPVPAQQGREALGLHPKGLRFRRDGERVHLAECPADPSLLARGERAARAVVAGLNRWMGPGWPGRVSARPARVAVGMIGSADAWTRHPGDLLALRARYGAACEDMESAFVAQVAALHRLPFLAVRAIANNEAASPLAPRDVPAALAAAGARAAAVLVRLLREP